MRKLLMGLALVIALPSSAQSQPSDAGDVYVVHGACIDAKFGPLNISDICSGKLVSFTTATGRVAFVFTLEGDSIVQLSGKGIRQSHPDSAHVLQPIDMVRTNVGNDNPENLGNIPSQGSCLFGDLFSGPSTISCRVNLRGRKDGLVILKFRTDGDAPELISAE